MLTVGSRTTLIFLYSCISLYLCIHRCIRGKGGFNNNPDTAQLRASLRKLLMKNDVTCSINANCLALEASNCSSIIDIKASQRSAPLVDACPAEADDLSDDELLLFLQMQATSLTELQKAVVGYMAGHLIRKLRKRLECATCVMALYNSKLDQTDFPHLRLIHSKQRGGLLLPAKTVVLLVQVCEKLFRFYVSGWNSNGISAEKNLLAKLMCMASQTDIEFDSLDQHDRGAAKEDFNLHSTQLKKAICAEYLRIRLLTYGQKYFTDVIQRNNVGKRQKLTKSILFKSL